MGRHERMKRLPGSGMKDRDKRSRGIEIHIADAFVIKPTAPFKLAKHEARRKQNWSDSSDNSFEMSHGGRVETRAG